MFPQGKLGEVNMIHCNNIGCDSITGNADAYFWLIFGGLLSLACVVREDLGGTVMVVTGCLLETHLFMWTLNAFVASSNTVPMVLAEVASYSLFKCWLWSVALDWFVEVILQF